MNNLTLAESSTFVMAESLAIFTATRWSDCSTVMSIQTSAKIVNGSNPTKVRRTQMSSIPLLVRIPTAFCLFLRLTALLVFVLKVTLIMQIYDYFETGDRYCKIFRCFGELSISRKSFDVFAPMKQWIRIVWETISTRY
jgi:hypothetical protein